MTGVTKGSILTILLGQEKKEIFYSRIDSRYIGLLATFLERGTSGRNPTLGQQIRFVSWNYDLQIQDAYGYFLNDAENRDYISIDQSMPFIPWKGKDLQICHLNGFQGFYHHMIDDLGELDGAIVDFNEPFKPANSSDPSEITDFETLLNSCARDYDGLINDKSIQNLLSYAWETDNPKTRLVREQAKDILRNSRAIVIVGYSFPPFNREIDRDLFSGVKADQVIYQSPEASEKLLKQAFGIPSSNIALETENMNQFAIPTIF